MDFLLSFIGISILVVVVLLLLTSCVKIVPQAQALVVERLGAYLDTWSVGVHFKMPFIDRVAKRVILKDGHDAPEHHRRPGARPDPDLQGDHQHQNARSPGRGHRSLGDQGKPGGA